VNFLAADLTGTLLGVLLFAPLMVAPGYVMAWLADVRGFRNEPLLWRILWALPLSAFAMPIVAFLVGASLGMPLLWAVYAAAILGALSIRRTTVACAIPKWLWISAAVWLMVTVLSGIDLPWGDRLYAPVLIYDHNLRTALIDGISRSGLPAVNALFHPGQDVLLRYHYLWFIPISLVEQMGGALVTSRHALLASAVWCGWSLVATSLLFLRYFLGKNALGRLGIWTTTVLTAAGLDIIPAFIGGVAFMISGKGWIAPSAEWGSNTVTSLPHAALFETHHMAAAIACCLGFLLLQKPTTRAMALAALCFASAPGLSIYVALAFAVSAVAIIAASVLRRDFAATRAWMGTGIAASIVCLPYLLVLARSNGGSGGGSFVRFEVRQFFGVLPLPQLAASLVNLTMLPLHYLIEAGVVAIAGVLFWKRYRRHRDIVFLVAIPMLIASFLRSGVIANNDLGWRAPLMPQFLVLTCFAAPMLALLLRTSRKGGGFRLLRAALALGFLGLAWDFYIMRAYIPLADHDAAPLAKWLQPQPGRRNHDLRLVYETLAATLPRKAVVQGNPNVWDQMYLGAYAQRQAASFGADCGSQMGGDPAACKAMHGQLLPAFNETTGAPPDVVCAAWGIDAMVVVEDDALWKRRSEAFAGRDPLVRTPFAEAYACGNAARRNIAIRDHEQ